MARKVKDADQVIMASPAKPSAALSMRIAPVGTKSPNPTVVKTTDQK